MRHKPKFSSPQRLAGFFPAEGGYVGSLCPGGPSHIDDSQAMPTARSREPPQDATIRIGAALRPSQVN